MKKIKKFLKSNIKVILAFVIGGTIVVGTKAATSFSSTLVLYNNTKSVDTALDELYTKVNLSYVDPMNMGTPQYYAFGAYKGWCNSTDTSCNSYANFPTTATTPPSGKNVYLGLYKDGQYGVCIKRNGKEHCFRGRNYKAEAKHVQEVFSDVSCLVNSYYVGCNASDFSCYVLPDGAVSCPNQSDGSSCGVNSNGSVTCR